MTDLDLRHDKTAARYRDIFIIVSGLALFIYIVLRAYLLSFTVDENGTYGMFVSRGIVLPEVYDHFSANDHPLNTAMMIFFEKIFGSGELSLRFPNVLAGLLYLFSTAMMVRRMRPALFSAAAFLVLNLNPYLVQYFSLARGYGLACGLTAFAFWQAWRYFEDGYRFRHLLAAMLTSSLAVYANFTYLNLYLPAVGLLGLFAFWKPGAGQIAFKSRIAHPALVLTVVSVTLLVVIPVAMKMKAAGALFTGGAIFFWEHTVQSVIEASLFDTPGSLELKAPLALLVEIMYWLSAAAVLAWTTWGWIKKKRPVFPLFVLLALTLSVVSILLQYELMGTEYVTLRMALFLLWPFLLLLLLAAEKIPGPKIIPAIVCVLLAAPLTYHFAGTLSLYHGFGWPTGEDNKAVVKLLEEYRGKQPAGTRLRIGIEPVLVVTGFDYYKKTVLFSQYDITDHAAYFTHALNDFCFLTATARAQADSNLWTVYKEFPSGNVLLSRKNKKTAPRLTKELNVSDYGEGTTLNQEQKNVYFGSKWTDSLSAPAHFMACVKFTIRQTDKSRGVIFITCNRGGKEYFAQGADLYTPPEKSGEWIENMVTMILPDDFKPGDEIISAIAWQSGDPVIVKQMRLSVEAY
ncbi:MAG: hypothetical protein FD123_76 [Bacteroidetes bacterium]|nr:MAG: hypothetical protein FD123_76 [Bacteroidota bacterium]